MKSKLTFIYVTLEKEKETENNEKEKLFTDFFNQPIEQFNEKRSLISMVIIIGRFFEQEFILASFFLLNSPFMDYNTLK